MRTTVTLDSDTAALLREEARRTGLSFKEVLNRAVKCALAPRSEKIALEPLFPAAFPSSLSSFNRLSSDWDDQNTIQELSA